MRKLSKKVFSLVLCICIVISAVIAAAPRTGAASGTDIPLIYIVGRGAQIVRPNADGTTQSIYPVPLNMDYLLPVARKHLDVFAKAFFTQEWGEFCDVLYDEVMILYGDLALDNNGEVTDASYVPEAIWSKQSIDASNNNGGYGVQQFTFKYDWRIDPMAVADELHAYIEAVMEVTGANSVAVSGRSYGANIALAYMQKYDAEHVSDLILYCGSQYGVTQCSKAFSGELYLESDGIERFMYDRAITEDECIQALIESFLTLFNKTYGLDIATWAVNNVYSEIYLDIVPRILRGSFGTFPSYWSMVGTGDYEKAKDVVFYGVDKADYAGLIQKTDYYHYNVQCKLEELLLDYKNRGIDVYNIVKYGNASIPMHADTERLSDGRVYVDETSLGATTAKVGKELSEEYIASVAAKGKSKYISVDKQVDASTCLLPDSTWFIKELAHKYFPNSVDGLIEEMINNDNMTVWDNSRYPQFMFFDTQTQQISPLDETNKNTHERWEVNFWDALRRFLENLYLLISRLIAKA